MRIVFAGTPDFAVPSLRAAARHNEVVAVYTQPDRPAGRGRGLAASPVKREAVARGIPVMQPETLRGSQAQQDLRDLAPDLVVVVGAKHLMPPSLVWELTFDELVYVETAWQHFGPGHLY